MANNKITKREALEYAVRYIGEYPARYLREYSVKDMKECPVGDMEVDDSWFTQYDPADVITELVEMMAMLDRASASMKKLDVQPPKEEGVDGMRLLAFLSDTEGEGFTVDELLEEFPAYRGNWCGVFATMRDLVLAGVADEYRHDGRTYFCLATGD